ncbi:transmembrane 42-like [Paramuricea clavata]|uniref:Transmembrane 42-like n=1 Tax=Paramuricea clavata TaxID=317549 RepID=A0A6S7IW80_PARCT|nr:transmembrane 42-like [Paramuricea clavata]
MLSVSLALTAGFCAAIASLCAKLAFSPEIVFKDVCESVDFWIVECSGHCDKIILLSRIILFVLTFLCNGLMWTLFVKSMRNSSSAQALITNSASNFISSALFGKFFFGEILSMQWWLGASLIILGLYIINKNKIADDVTVTGHKKDC